MKKLHQIYKSSHPLYKRDFIDYDYISSLKTQAKEGNKEAKEALEWLDRFTKEFYKGNFNNDDTDLHTTLELKRDCYNRNNSMERDLSNRSFNMLPYDEGTNKG